MDASERDKGNPWMKVLGPSQKAEARCFFFHYAGGSAQFFRAWTPPLTERVAFIAIQMPGRWERLREPLFQDISPLVAELVKALSGHLDRPYVFLGYSLGATVAFEVSRLLREKGLPLPQKLITVSGAAPHLPISRRAVHHLSDQEFIAAVNEIYGGLPQVILDNADLLAIVTPILRADLTIFENYSFTPGSPFDFPISSFGGASDKRITAEKLAAWKIHTTGDFSSRQFSGGHFFTQEEDSSAFLLELNRQLDSLV